MGNAAGSLCLCKKNHYLSKGHHGQKPWMEMRDYLLWVAYNSGLKTEKQLREDWESAQMMANI